MRDKLGLEAKVVEVRLDLLADERALRDGQPSEAVATREGTHQETGLLRLSAVDLDEALLEAALDEVVCPDLSATGPTQETKATHLAGSRCSPSSRGP